jgi:O-antigen/teichoic acid export membrane protein
MGIVRKQSIQSSVLIYFGFVFGAFNTLYLFPHFFTTEEFGLTRLLLDVSALLAIFCTFGSTPATLKFNPFYRSYLSPQKNDLPFLTIMACIIGCILLMIIVPANKDWIIRKFGQRSPLFVQHFSLIYPLTIGYTFWLLFEAHSWSLQNTVLPNFLKEVSFRIITALLIVLFIFHFVDFHSFINLFSFLYVIPVAVLFWYLISTKKFFINFKISSVTKRLWKQIITFSLFLFSGQFLNILARTSDAIIISSQSVGGLADTAVYTIAVYMVTLMEVPMRGITGIATSVVAYAWKDKDMKKIEDIYKKTALNLIILGLGIWGILMLNTQNAIGYFGARYAMLPTLLLITGIAKLIDLGTGLNAQILLSSKYWKVDFITSMCFVLISIPLNIFLVKKFNILGAAYGNLIAICFYNLARYIFVWKLFKLQPFDKKNLYALFIAGIAFVIAYIIPTQKNIYIDAIVRSIVFVVLYAFPILYFSVSEDFKQVLQIAVDKLRKRKEE